MSARSGAKEKGPAVIPRGLETGAVANLVLSNERLRSLRSPEFEADARPEDQAVDRVLAVHALRDPRLDVDRAEVVADQAAHVDGSQIAAVARNGAARAGVGRGLDFEVSNRADFPLADLVDGREVAIQRVAAGDGSAAGQANRDAAWAGRPGVDVIEEVCRRHPVVAEVGERHGRLKCPIVRVWRADPARAVRSHEAEGGRDEPATAQVPRKVDRLKERVGKHFAVCDRQRRRGIEVTLHRQDVEHVEGLDHAEAVGGPEEIPARHVEERHGLRYCGRRQSVLERSGFRRVLPHHQ